MENILRHLLYEEKPANAFSIEEVGTIDFALFEVLMQMGELKDERSIERLFNDAYFVCTLLVDYYSLPYMHIKDCKALINRAYRLELSISNIVIVERYSYIVLIVAYCLLIRIDKWKEDTKLKRVISQLDAIKNEKAHMLNIVFSKITSATSTNKSHYSANIFHRRKITSNILTEIDWYKQTKEYNIEKIKEVVGYAATNEEKILIIDSIEANVKERIATKFITNEQYPKIIECLKELREGAQDKEMPLIKLSWPVSNEGSSDSSSKKSETEEKLRQAKNTIDSLNNRIDEYIIQIEKLKFQLVEKDAEKYLPSSIKTDINVEDMHITCGPYEIAPKKKTAFASVIWALKELNFFIKQEDGSYATNRSDVIDSLLTTKGNADQLLPKALKTDTFMNVFRDLLDKALEMYSKDENKG